MSLRILSVASPLVSLSFFPAFVVAGINVTAICLSASYSWTFNSIGQSPCVVTAYLLSTCHNGSYTLLPLPTIPEVGYGYQAPNVNDATECDCNTVLFSLISACGACQGQVPLDWSDFVANCGSLLQPPSQFPNPVPAGTYVPHWAILDVTNKNSWNPNESYAAGDNPEYGPGAIFGPSGVYTSSASASASSTASSSTSSHSGGHTGAIAGGVVGGIAVISTVVAAIFYLRRRRSQAASAGVGASQPMLNDGAVAQSSFGSPLTMRFYDPDDPTTFPGYQGGPRILDIPPASQVPLSSHVGTQADVQTSLPHARDYHGFPMPST